MDFPAADLQALAVEQEIVFPNRERVGRFRRPKWRVATST